MRKRLLLLASTFTVAIISMVAIYHLLKPYARARELLTKVASLKVGSSSFAEAKQMGMTLGSAGNDPCSPADCYWTFSVDNTKLPGVWRGESEHFIAGFRVENSVVSEQRFMFQIGTGVDAQTAEFWERETWPHYPKQFVVGTETSPTRPRFRSYVNLTPATPADVRERYLTFNLACLWKYHGCKDAGELLSVVSWK
jgi:hypothetical protein